MKQKIGSRILIFLIFFVGLSLLLYPMISNWWNQRRSDALIDSYVQQTAQISQTDLQQYWKRAEAYNQTLSGKGVPDAFADTTPEEDADYLSQLNFREDGIMAYLKIPKISVNLPIYHTTKEEVMEKGVGHLQGSALPVGGANTHCVFSTHRGLPTAALFTDLDQLAIGNHFYIYVLDQVLAYEVDQIKVVEPDDTQNLNVQAGQDLVTLVTCTPYGVNSHRLLVRGCRTDQPLEDTVTPMKQILHIFGWKGKLLIALLAIFVAFGIFRRMQKAAQKREQNQKRGGENP
jgi:sortase A